MLQNLTAGFSDLVRKIRKKNVITPENISEMLREIRKSLLNADVSLEVVENFLKEVEVKSTGEEVSKHLSPGEMIVKIIENELKKVLGGELRDLNLRVAPPAVVMMVGVQGSGKTTTTAKLAHFIKKNLKKDCLVASIDVYRPAAMEQLKQMAEANGIKYYENTTIKDPIKLAEDIYQFARKSFVDLLILDTAGRMDTDTALMDELKQVEKIVKPIETLIVIDSMLGSRSAEIAKVFNENVKITGCILSKMDSDARGGALLSVSYITKAPVKFLGGGEKIGDLEKFYPERITSRILGMGDVLGMIESMEGKLNLAEAKKLEQKLKSGKGFTLTDLRWQLKQMLDMGGITSLLEKMPINPQMAGMLQKFDTTKEFKKNIAMIDSMTEFERKFPETLNNSRKERITKGSGTNINDLNRLLKQYKHMSKLMKGSNPLAKVGNIFKNSVFG